MVTSNTILKQNGSPTSGPQLIRDGADQSGFWTEPTRLGTLDASRVHRMHVNEEYRAESIPQPGEIIVRRMRKRILSILPPGYPPHDLWLITCIV
jgi:hypothetical protein